MQALGALVFAVLVVPAMLAERALSPFPRILLTDHHWRHGMRRRTVREERRVEAHEHQSLFRWLQSVQTTVLLRRVLCAGHAILPPRGIHHAVESLAHARSTDAVMPSH